MKTLSLDTTKKFAILHIVNHVLATVGLIYLISNFSYAWLTVSIVSFLILGIFGVNIGLHRYFAHQSFETSKQKERALLLLTIFTSLGSPAMWCSVHLTHHQYSDTPRDPHDPNRLGILKTWFTIWDTLHISKRLFIRFLKTPELTFVHQNYFSIIAVSFLVLGIIDWRLPIFLLAIPMVGCFHGAASIGVIPHLNIPGNYTNFVTKDSAKNSILATFTSLGEGWHNNHHKFPSRYRQGVKPWEIDVSAFLIEKLFINGKTK